ncbi:Bro-N domain-containing protein [Cereibacter johrii]|uniref:BRO-N domain-containing protein n=1 Tax=Cereibacter johrii TaxID=445629 RepID=UPI002B263931|nr:Bro-N domain-containing protein [Cereibacter johrii]MEA5163386.1 Bro-N domain-containing protein [Cereibacter johrii]
MRVVEIEGNPWFAAANVCKALDIVYPARSIANPHSVNIKRSAVEGQRGKPMIFPSEVGLYDLVSNSRKPEAEAEAFKSWVTGTVLPVSAFFASRVPTM